ncbi:phage neck terminator protein [Clostridium rectalis]|uniref:phage neck terminator protein n=1 Tax=Clostridium rectalis TaxID=2040295 RepID=UPI000F63A13E|nr:hypothetical protein [Clostridium rectalis]
MVNIVGIWNKINSILNVNLREINPSYKFIKSNNIANLPTYPYCVTNIITAYIQDKDDIKGTIIEHPMENSVKLQRIEEPQMTISLNFYSNNREECLTFLDSTVSSLKTNTKWGLTENDIIIIAITGFTDRTFVMETDYVYQYGVDMRIRVLDITEMQVEQIEKISLVDKNSDNTIII